MRACLYVNIAAGAVLFGASSFSACGAGHTTAAGPSSTEPASSAIVAEPISTGATSASATPASSSASLAAAPQAAQTPRTPDRSVQDISAIVTGNRDAFRACYDRSLKTHPGIKGRFMLAFVVNPDGSVKSAEGDVTKSEIHAPDLESCAVGVLKGLKFPPSKRGMESTVSYPFDFNPKGPPPKSGSSGP